MVFQVNARPKALRIILAAIVLLIYFFFVSVHYLGRYEPFDEHNSPNDTPLDGTILYRPLLNGTRVRNENELRDFVPVVNFLATNENPSKREFGIAYVILVHSTETILGAAAMIERLYDPKHTFVVHIDAKATQDKLILLYEALSKLKSGDNPSAAEHFKIKPQNNLIVIQNHAINWCGFAMIQATFDMISAALQTGRWFDSVVLLSGSCHPVKPPVYIENKLKELRGRLVLNLDGGPGYQGRAWRTKERYDLYRMDYYYDYVNLPLRVEEFDTVTKNYPQNLTRMTGSQWVLLSREFAEYIITSPWVKKLFIAHSTSHCADESMFQLIAKNSPFANQTFEKPTDDLQLRYEVWRGNKASPEGLNETTAIPAIEGHALFARKFPSDRSVRSGVNNLADKFWNRKEPSKSEEPPK